MTMTMKLNMNMISVMVVEDSAVARELICATLGSDPRIRVVSAVDNAEAALRLIPSLAPDAISMDIRLPGMSGIEATRRIMEQHPTPIIILASDLRRETVNGSMEALRAGALLVLEKPTVESRDGYRVMARRLCEHFVNMSTVKVVRQRFNGKPAAPPPSLLPPLASPLAPPLAPPAGPVSGARPPARIEVVGVVASTGGPAAVASLLRALGRDFPVPILVVQHMGAAFLEGYAAWLDASCDLGVGLAVDGVRPCPGRAYIGPGNHHLTYQRGRLQLVEDSGGSGFVPSGDMLFRSLAASTGAHAVGVILTGMGDDGARGLLEMRHAGAHTIGQDSVSSVVYGMPAAASALGAVVEELAIGAIPARLAALVAGARPGAGMPAPGGAGGSNFQVAAK